MHLSIFFILGLFAGLCVTLHTTEVSNNARQLYNEFKQKYGKAYSNEEDTKRFQIFERNLIRMQIIQTNEQGTAKYGVTKFADLTADEFSAMYTNARFEMPDPSERLSNAKDYVNIPESVDWRKKGAVTPVEDQGTCGSCWAFSTVANIEGQWFLKKGKLLVLSKQQLVDCDTFDAGCNGGYPPKTYGEIRRLGGLQLQRDYPYKAVEQNCKLDRGKIVAYINSSIVLDDDEEDMASWVSKNGPLNVGMNADQLQFYSRGISHPRSCNPQGLNHAVLIVGYGMEGFNPFWIVKNTWGGNWGEAGYFRIYRGDGTCGINRLASSAIIH